MCIVEGILLLVSVRFIPMRPKQSVDHSIIFKYIYTPFPNFMNVAQKFLVALYSRTRKNPLDGFVPDVIRKSLLLDKDEMNELLFELSEKGLIRSTPGSTPIIFITGPGMQTAKALIRDNDLAILRFRSCHFIPPTDKLVFGFKFFYDLVTPDKSEANHSIGVFVSDIASMQLQLSYEKGQSGEKILLECGRQWLAEKIREGSLAQYEERLIMSKDLRDLPVPLIENLPTVEEAEFIIEKSNSTVMEDINGSQLGSLIVDNRHFINTIFLEKYGEPLLTLPQERNLVDFFKTANSEDEFGMRVISLGSSAREMNLSILRNLTQTTDPKVGSVQLLKNFLTARIKEPDSIIKPLQCFGRLRSGYPTHADRADVVGAYRFFGLPYPVTDFAKGWNTLLNHYLKVLEALKNVLLTENTVNQGNSNEDLYQDFIPNQV